MRASPAVLLTALLALPAPAAAQVSGEIALGGYPIGGWIRFGERPRYVEVVPYRPRGGRIVIVERQAPRMVVLERWHRHKHDRHCRHDGLHRRIIYYDRYGDRYYDRYRPGLIRVEVIIHDGRYFWYDRDDRYDRDRYRGDRWYSDGERDDRWDDRWYDRP
jgi:hypothetical protein